MTFQQAFLEINGFEATPEQVKRALSVARIVQEADLDPILLVYLADAQAQTARERGAAEIRRTTKEAVEGLRNALPSVEDAKNNIGALASVRTALNDLTKFAHETITFAALFSIAVGLAWTVTLIMTWKTAYDWGRDDALWARHQAVCNDLNGSIAATSAYLRKLGYPQGADKLEQRYDHRCR